MREGSSWNGRQVLIVGGDLGRLETIIDVLSKMNFIISVADNGFKAIEMVQDGWFDTILMDIELPGIDGIETLKRIKYIKPSAKIILITAFTAEDVVLEARKEGAAEVICSPLDIGQLGKMLVRTYDTARWCYYYT